MKLTRIRARNFKGRDINCALSPVTMVVGDNFSGKTAILDAIRVGLIGYLPRLGKQPSSTWKLAGIGDVMEVALDTDQTTISHKWEPGKNGTSYEGSVPWKTPTVLLDPREYFEQTAQARAGMVFRLCDAKAIGYDDQALLARLAAVEAIPMKIARPIIEDLVKKTQAAVAARNGSPPQEWLEKYIESVKADLKEHTATAKRYALKTAANRPSSVVSPKDVSAELAAAIAKRRELDAKIAAIEMAAASSAKAIARRAQVEKELAAMPADFSAIRSMESRLEEIPDDSAFQIAKEELLAARKRLEEARQDLDRANAEYAGVRSPESLTACPYCKCSQPGWRKHLDEAYRRELATASAKIDAAKAAVVQRQKAMEHCQAVFAEASKADLDRQGEAELLKKQIMDLRTAQFNRVKLEAELAGLVASTVDTSINPEAIKSESEKLSGRIAELQDQQFAFEQHQKNIQERDQAETEIITANVTVDVYKAAVKDLQAMLGDLVERAFNDLLTKARLFTDGILRSPLIYRGGDLGRMEGDRFVSWETFSGTEEALAFAGLSVALAQHAPCKIVLIDELGRLTQENKAKVLTRMVALAEAGHIDGFIGCDVAAPKVAGVAIINV